MQDIWSMYYYYYHSSNILTFYNLISWKLEMSALEAEIDLAYFHYLSFKLSF